MRAEVRRAADRAAATLYEQQRDRIFNLCLAMLHDRGDAEDAVQETFARVTQRIGALDGDPAGYLVVVARNVCRDELRRRSRQRTERADAGGGLAGRGAEEAAVDRSTLRDIWRRLGAGERTLFAYAFSGLSLAEIAQRTGTSVDAAAQRMSRARQQARRLVGVPAALLLPLLNGQAMGRLVQRLHSLGGQIPAVILRSDPAQQLLVPLVLGIVAGSLSVPGSGGRMAPARPDLALAGPAPVLATATSPDASGLHVAPAVPVLPQRTPAAPSRAVAAAPQGRSPAAGRDLHVLHAVARLQQRPHRLRRVVDHLRAGVRHALAQPGRGAHLAVAEHCQPGKLDGAPATRLSDRPDPLRLLAELRPDAQRRRWPDIPRRDAGPGRDGGGGSHVVTR